MSQPTNTLPKRLALGCCFHRSAIMKQPWDISFFREVKPQEHFDSGWGWSVSGASRTSPVPAPKPADSLSVGQAETPGTLTLN